MKLRFSREAAAELRSASDRYEELHPGLGDEFLRAVRQTQLQISEWPSAGRPFDEYARGRIVGRFPYWLIYEQRDTLIIVTVVAHQSRGDDYRQSLWTVEEAPPEYLPLAA